MRDGSEASTESLGQQQTSITCTPGLLCIAPRGHSSAGSPEQHLQGALEEHHKLQRGEVWCQSDTRNQWHHTQEIHDMQNRNISGKESINHVHQVTWSGVMVSFPWTQPANSLGWFLWLGRTLIWTGPRYISNPQLLCGCRLLQSWIRLQSCEKISHMMTEDIVDPRIELSLKRFEIKNT